MKFNKLILAVAFAAAALATASCSDKEGQTGITYYADIVLDGPTKAVAPAGTPFVDPGFTATMQGKDVTDEVEVNTDMNLASPQPGYYTITYSLTNADGFTASAVRYVLVTDPSDPISGYYTTAPDSYRDYNGQTYFGGYPVVVYGTGSDRYYVSDLLGGWYEYRAGYGAKYALTGEIAVAADGSISLISSFLQGWADGADYLEGAADTAAGKLSWTVGYAGMMAFNVVLDKDVNE